MAILCEAEDTFMKEEDSQGRGRDGKAGV